MSDKNLTELAERMLADIKQHPAWGVRNTEAKALACRVVELEAVVERLPKITKGLYVQREDARCWYDANNDCGNWSGCDDFRECPLRTLREIAGLVPQEDGGVDKQDVPVVGEESAGPTKPMSKRGPLMPGGME